MLNVQYRRLFLKDLKKLKRQPVYDQVFDLVFNIMPEAASLREIPNIKQLKGDTNRYRIRIGDYRIGFESFDNDVEFMRVLNRKEFYRYFP